MERRWWRFDDWFRVVRRDGTPVARAAPIFDRTPPIWFRHAWFLGLLVVQTFWFGVSFGPRWLIGVSVAVLLMSAIALVAWDRRHRVRSRSAAAR